MRENLETRAVMGGTLPFTSGSLRETAALTEVNIWSDFAGEICWTETGLTVSVEGPSGIFSWRSTDQQTLIFAGELHASEVHHTLAGLTRTIPDTVLLQQLSQLTGGFALVLCIPHSQSVLLVTDQFGIRPLYHWSKGGRTVFATRLDRLIHWTRTSLSLDWSAVAHYLNFTYVPGPGTIYHGVSVLPPGSVVSCQRDGVEVSSYWDLQYSAQADVSLEESALAMRHEIERAVYQALPTELTSAATGTFLSGGTDSGTIAGLVAQLRSPLKAYSIAFHEGNYNEIGYAKRLASHFGLIHHVHYLTAAELLESIPVLVHTCDQPLGNTSLVAAWRCAQLAAESGTQVLLAGDGGDELFGGNERYSKDWIYALYHHLPAWTRRMLLALIRTFPAHSLLRNRLYNFTYRGNLANPERFYMNDAFASKWGETFLSPQLGEHVPPSASLDIVRSYYERANAQDELNRLLYVDMKMAIWGNDLPKVQTAARIAGIRVRFPFLDPKLAAFTGTLPPELKVRGLKKRYLFKRAVADLLPDEILQKPKKGFGVPIAEWIRTDGRVREAVLDPVLDSQSFVRECVTIGSLRSIVEKHLRGCWDYGGWLWATMMLERWTRAKQAMRYTCILFGLITGEMVVSEMVVAEARSE